MEDTQEWVNSLYEDEDQAELEAQQAANDLEIMLVLYHKGYHPSKFDIIIKRAKDLGMGHQETITRIKNK